MKKINALATGLLLTAGTMIVSPAFGQNTKKILKQTSSELIETIPDDIGEYPIKWIEKHFGKERTIEIINQNILKQINEIRKNNSVKPLEINKELTEIAQKYSQEMYINTRYNHIGKDGSTPMKRGKKAGYNSTYMLENIGYNYYSINDAINHRSDKINYPHHFANMIDPKIKYLGSGYSEGYRVNMFSGD